tara:strand:+ start:146 stop:511 length:366 start_codon:yes stop_codon:yes gene_type:complete
MKITKTQLKQIIKEELQRFIEGRNMSPEERAERNREDYKRRQDAAIRRMFSSALSDKPREEPRVNLVPQFALGPVQRVKLGNEIKKLEARYKITDNEEEKKKILDKIKDLKTQRDAPYKEE